MRSVLLAMVAATMAVEAVADALAWWPVMLAGGGAFALLGALTLRA